MRKEEKADIEDDHPELGQHSFPHGEIPICIGRQDIVNGVGSQIEEGKQT